MSIPEQRADPYRLPPREKESIHRGRAVRFTFDGKSYKAFEGDTIASALLAAGQQALSRSFKYHRPRGLLCANGDCPNCLVQVGNEPNVRGCLRRVENGMQVRSQNRWPSLAFDLLHLSNWADRFLPPGFYYKAFLRPRLLWPLYEYILRHIAGLGRVDSEATTGFNDKQYRHPEVAVIGGGPAGMRAALAAAAEGTGVLLIEEKDALGGHLRYSRGEPGQDTPSDIAQEIISKVRSHSGIEVLTGTNLFGWYQHGWLSAAGVDRLYKIRAGAVVLATGSRELPLVFENNDLPGIMLGGAVQQLIRCWSVKPGERAVIVAPHRAGWQAALDLLAAGVTVAAVANPVGGIDQDIETELAKANVRLLPDTTIQRAQGRGHLSRVWLTNLAKREHYEIECDLLIASAGYSPATELLLQAGGTTRWIDSLGGFSPDFMPEATFLAGNVRGPQTLEEVLEQGEQAGRQAASFVHGNSNRQPPSDTHFTASMVKEGSRSASPIGPHTPRKSFVCYCEDVTFKDLTLAIQEGYDSLELLKRYSTISMGPCQGKMCSSASIQICAQQTNQSVGETGRTTSRPPVRPVALGVLAGRPMDPVRRSPLHDWHIDQGAQMMVAGDWMRPEHYGDPRAEVKAVRKRVGLIDVSTLGKLHLHGPDVPELLERVYTNRWQNLALGRVRYGLMTTEEGIVFDDGVTAHLDPDFYYMTTTSSGANRVYEWLEWWLQSGWDFDVHLHNATDLRAAMNLTGPFARQVLQELATEVDLSPEAFPYMHARQAKVAGVPALLMRIGFTGELGYEIHTPSGYALDLWRTLMEAGQPYGIQPFGVEAQRVLRLEKGHIIVGQDTDSLSDPLEAAMDWAVKFDKHDFLGRAFLKDSQEEGPKRRLVGFGIAEGIVPEEASQIVRIGSGPKGFEILGRVTSARWSPTLDQIIGLAWLPTDMSSPGTKFKIHSDGKVIEAIVWELPFYDSEGERLKG